MGVYEGRGQIGKAMKELISRWQDARMTWNDARAVDFEKRYIESIEMNLRGATGAMDHMAQLLAQIHKECD